MHRTARYASLTATTWLLTASLLASPLAACSLSSGFALGGGAASPSPAGSGGGGGSSGAQAAPLPPASDDTDQPAATSGPCTGAINHCLAADLWFAAPHFQPGEGRSGLWPAHRTAARNFQPLAPGEAAIETDAAWQTAPATAATVRVGSFVLLWNPDSRYRLPADAAAAGSREWVALRVVDVPRGDRVRTVDGDVLLAAARVLVDGPEETVAFAGPADAQGLDPRHWFTVDQSWGTSSGGPVQLSILLGQAPAPRERGNFLVIAGGRMSHDRGYLRQTTKAWTTRPARAEEIAVGKLIVAARARGGDADSNWSAVTSRADAYDRRWDGFIVSDTSRLGEGLIITKDGSLVPLAAARVVTNR